VNAGPFSLPLAPRDAGAAAGPGGR